ncbi:MAG: hypothetical protein US63_C0044G0006 [Candidatus Moranbacteria bacterium GW2011_GWC2_37_8]|nr:MAG: hypothetical protein US63_C0044G0006 [Candidatus Moranbacteria bacterium GW2011_GWC2_37_8]KKQ60273.1 MAG: hypothetical protein US82_C0041G0005 [Parcubacteria group bacterium GW2011_GWC1_38_22]KKQ79862.1 MAG: hypothetical protein UT03_C0039G0004 [Candidatus Moranbacteria bacterium GW2011_GWD2_38_7]
MNAGYSVEDTLKDPYEKLQAALERKEELQRALALGHDQNLKEEFFRQEMLVASLKKSLQVCW